MASFLRAARRPSVPGAIGACAAAAMIAAGLWTSLHYCLGAWKADPDIFVTVELWRGVHRHGLGFVRSWTYTQDNWLFSLIPISSLLYEAFGATPRVAALIGWFFFIVSVALTAWLAAKVAGRRAAAITACVLLFANSRALGDIGFLGYPISHNVSMAWGLLILLLALWGIERRAYAPCVAAAFAIFIDAVSDPWAGAAIAVPLILTSGAIAATNRRTRLGGCALALCLASTLALWTAQKLPFSGLRFLRRSDFQPGDLSSLAVNLRWGYRALAAMFNIVPGAHFEAAAPQAISFGVLAAGVVTASVLVLWGLRRASVARQLVGGVAVLSIAAITALYLLGPPNTGFYVGRFFPNLYFLGALLIAMAAADGWQTWPRVAKAAVAAYATLFVIAGVASAPQIWLTPLPSSEPPQATRLGAFLQAHGLTYGYGPFWGSSALTMGTLTHGAVTIRPVIFQAGRIARRPIEASRLWFAPSAEPAGRRLFLVIRNDGGECLSVSDWEGAARAQFGEPAERLAYDDVVVLVWDRPLAPLIAAN